MKRINPDTKTIYKHGDIEERNGKVMVFRCYGPKKYIKGELKGYFHERWNSLESVQKEKANRKPDPNNAKRLRDRRKRDKEKIKKNKIQKRLNPLTGEEFKRGDFDPQTKKYFEAYKIGIKDGYVAERWETRQAFIRSNFGHLLRGLRQRAKEFDVPCDVDLQYLIKIFPKDGRCPIFRTKFPWGLDFISETDGMKERTSPSVDRIVPKKGYVKGNVAIISIKANGIKTDATPDEIIKVANWLQKHKTS